MATTSIKQTIETIEDTITNNFSDEVKAVYFEKYTDTRKEKTYPQLSFYYSDSGTAQNDNVNIIALDFEFLDVIVGRDNINSRRKEVVSDLFDVASRFVTYLRNTNNLLIDPNVSITPFDSKYKDGLGGVQFTLLISIFKPCLIT